MASKNKIIKKTKNYSDFVFDPRNRPINLKKHRRLKKSMQRKGFMYNYPISVVTNGSGKKQVEDGQHRFCIAKELGLPIYYVEVEDRLDLQAIDGSIEKWRYVDHAGSFVRQGKPEYKELIKFHEEYNLPLSLCVGLLSGSTSLQKEVSERYYDGNFVIKDRAFAEKVAITVFGFKGYYNFKAYKHRNFVRALYACCRVKGFDQERLINKVKVCPEKLVNYSAVDDFLRMIEDIYNYHVMLKNQFPLALEAKKAMQLRKIIKK